MKEQRGNRAALLDAAISCIQQRGVARTTARDLVSASGTNLGAIGYHFGSKDALLVEALAECSRRWITQLGAAATTSDGGLSAMVSSAFSALNENRPIAVAYLEAWAQIERSPQLRDQLASHYREFRAAVGGLIQTLAETAPAQALDPAALGAVLVAIADGLMVQWLLEPDSVPDPSRLTGALPALASLLDH